MQTYQLGLSLEELDEIKDCINTSRDIGNQHDTQLDILRKIEGAKKHAL